MHGIAPWSPFPASGLVPKSAGLGAGVELVLPKGERGCQGCIGHAQPEGHRGTWDLTLFKGSDS